MEKPSNCLLIINNVSKHESIDLSMCIIQGLNKLSEILINFIPILKKYVEQKCLVSEETMEIRDGLNNLNIRLLIQPTYQELKDAIKQTSDDQMIKENYIVYIGSYCAGYYSDWLLKDGIVSANTVLGILHPYESRDKASEASRGIINILTPGSSCHWNKVLSKLQGKEPEKDLVRVFSFETDKGDMTQANSTAFCKQLCQLYQNMIKVDECLPCDPNLALLPLPEKNGSLFIFDEGCGQSSLLALSGFNLLIDAGYSHSPEFWKFLQRYERVDTCLLTTWNATNMFGFTNLLEKKSKSDQNGSYMNYCILPIGPNINNSHPPLQLESSLRINLEVQAMNKCKQLKTLEVPLSQMSRNEEALKSPHQLYFKLGHGFLEAFPLWPCTPGPSEDSKTYLDEWHNASKGPSSHFDEMVNNNPSACLLLWRGSKIGDVSTSSDEVMRILISSSCDETHLIRSLEEFSKCNSSCNNPLGIPPPKLTCLTKKSKEGNEIKKNPQGLKKEVAKGKVPEGPSQTKKIGDIKKTPSILDSDAKTGAPKNKEHTPPQKAPLKIEKKSAISDSAAPSKDADKKDNKQMNSGKSVKDILKVEPAKVKESIRAEKKPTTADKQAKTKEVLKVPKVSTIVEKEDLKPAKAHSLSSGNALSKAKGDVASKIKFSKPHSAKSAEILDKKKIIKKMLPDTSDKKPLMNTNTKEIKVNKKSASKEPDGDNIRIKSTQVSIPSSDGGPSPKPLNNVPADATVYKNDVESDPERADAFCHQPSISLNTDDTLNNIDTSELLGKMEEIRGNTDHEVEELLMVMTDLPDLHSTPLSDMVTESPGHTKTEEDVEPLKTDGFSIDQDIFNAQEDLSEDDKIGSSSKDDFLYDHFKVDNNEESLEHSMDHVGEIQHLKQYGIYDDDSSQELEKVQCIRDYSPENEDDKMDDYVDKEDDGNGNKEDILEKVKMDEQEVYKGQDIIEENIDNHDIFVENENNPQCYDDKNVYNTQIDQGLIIGRDGNETCKDMFEHHKDALQSYEDRKDINCVEIERKDDSQICNDEGDLFQDQNEMEGKQERDDRFSHVELERYKEIQSKNDDNVLCYDDTQSLEDKPQDDFGNKYEDDLQCHEHSRKDNYNLLQLEDSGELTCFTDANVVYDEEEKDTNLIEMDNNSNGQEFMSKGCGKDNGDDGDNNAIRCDDDIVEKEEIGDVSLTESEDGSDIQSAEREDKYNIKNDDYAIDVENHHNNRPYVNVEMKGDYDEEVNDYDNDEECNADIDKRNYVDSSLRDEVSTDEEERCDNEAVEKVCQSHDADKGLEHAGQDIHQTESHKHFDLDVPKLLNVDISTEYAESENENDNEMSMPDDVNEGIESDEDADVQHSKHDDNVSLPSQEDKDFNHFNSMKSDVERDSRHMSQPSKECKSGVLPFTGDFEDFLIPFRQVDEPHPLYHSPELNSTSPADSDLSCDIVKDHSIIEDVIDTTEQSNLRSMTPLDELSEEGSPRGTFKQAEGAFSHSEEDMRNVTDLEMDSDLSNMTPDIIKGLRNMNTFEPSNLAVKQICDNEDLFQYDQGEAPNIQSQDSRDQSKRDSEIVDLLTTDDLASIPPFEDDSKIDTQSNISERDSSVESASSVIAQRLIDQDLDSRNVVSHTLKGKETDIDYTNESYDIGNIEPSSHWNTPLGLPMPTIPATSKTASKSSGTTPTNQKKGPSLSDKGKSAPLKVIEVAKLAQKSSDSPKVVSSPRSSVTPKSSAKSADLRRTPTTKQTKNSDAVDHSELPAFFVDVAYIPVDHDGNVSHDRVSEAFFTRVRAREYILPGIEHDPAVLDSLLAARRKGDRSVHDAEVRLVPVRMTETLRKWAEQHSAELCLLGVTVCTALEPCTTSRVRRIDF